jgi:DNA-directed RNA polymerase subunit RPC12/RpoP
MPCEPFHEMLPDGTEVTGFSCTRGLSTPENPAKLYRCATCLRKFEVFGKPNTVPYVCEGCLKGKKK